jgi:hypothetical protein
MQNKKGDVNWTVIMLILGVIVLVVSALGLGLGWDKIFPFLYSGNNVNTIQTQCLAACTSGSTYDFCTFSRTLKEPTLTNDAGKVTGSMSGTCDTFSALTKYGIEACPSLQPCAK